MIEFTHFINLAAEAAVETSKEPSGGVVGLLGLNWKLFVAQLINFGVIVFIVWKWVLTPVTTALENRTKKIEQSLVEAEAIKKQLKELEKFKAEEERNAQEKYQWIVAEAEKVAEKSRDSILSDARSSAEKLLKEAEARNQEEREKLVSDIKEEMAVLVVAASEKILREKLDPEKDKRLIEESLKALKR